MLSVLITSYKEPATIGAAIESFLPQMEKNDELLAAAPDTETIKVILVCARKDKRVKIVRDKGIGKPAALNSLFKLAKGDIWILSDGDILVNKDAVRPLVAPFADPAVGAVSGRPLSTSPRKTLLGYWSHLLTDVGAHQTRLHYAKKRAFFVCSGYLFAVRKGIIGHIPENALSDDAVISTAVWMKGWKIAYAPRAKVFVSYPKTFQDWVKQKRRSAGGYTQLHLYFKNPPTMRSFSREALRGFLTVWAYPKTAKEMLYTLLLFPARLYLWGRIYWDVVLQKKAFGALWQRVETTK